MEPKELSPEVAGKILDADFQNVVRKVAAGKPLTVAERSRIEARAAGSQIYPDLTLTGIYNVLEKLRSGAALDAKDKAVHDKGLVSVLKQLHDDLDAAVLEAYGWSDMLACGPPCSGGLRPSLAARAGD